MVFHRKSNLLARIREGAVNIKAGRSLEEERAELDRHCARDPWNMLSAKDPSTGTPLILTKNEDKNVGEADFQPYPHDREEFEHLFHLVRILADPSNFLIVVGKSRQIMFSITALLVFYHRIIYKEAENILVAKKKEAGAIRLINDKIRETHKHAPDWFRRLHPITPEPKNIITAINTDSRVTAVPQTFSEGESRGESGTVFVDEAAFTAQLPQIMTAAIAMSKQIVLGTSPKKMGPGSATMQLYIKRAKEHATVVLTPCKGITIYRAMVPESDKALVYFEAEIVLDKQKKKSWFYTNDAARRQEQGINWQAGDGEAYFPEFEMYGGMKTYGVNIEGLDPTLPIDRGLDFGVRRPACTWSQTNPLTHRITLVRAHIGHNCDPWSYARFVRYMSGEISLEEMGYDAVRNLSFPPAMTMVNEIKSLAKQGLVPEPPWFDSSFRFRSWGGNEIYHTIPSGPGAKSTQYVQVFAQEKVPITPAGGPKERREYLLRQVLLPREDGVPSLLIDELGGKLMADALAFGLTRPQNESKSKVDAEEPTDDHYYKDLYDAFGYTLVGTLDIDWSTIEHASLPKRDAEDLARVERLRALGIQRWGEEGGIGGVGDGTMYEKMMATRW